MNCKDCAEDIKESERLTAHYCSTCYAPMHFECAMSDGYLAEYYCERCYHQIGRLRAFMEQQKKDRE